MWGKQPVRDLAREVVSQFWNHKHFLTEQAPIAKDIGKNIGLVSVVERLVFTLLDRQANMSCSLSLLAFSVLQNRKHLINVWTTRQKHLMVQNSLVLVWNNHGAPYFTMLPRPNLFCPIIERSLHTWVCANSWVLVENRNVKDQNKKDEE